MAYFGTRDRRREKEKGSEEGEREPPTPRITEPLQEGITAGNGTLGQKDSAAKRCGERKASGLVTAAEKERGPDKGQTARRRGKGEGRRGVQKGKATDPTGCRAFSDVVERSETIGTERKRRRRRYVWEGTRPVATHGKWQQSRRRRGLDTGRTTKGRRHENGERGKRERRPPTPWSVEPFGRWLRGTKPSAQKKE